MGATHLLTKTPPKVAAEMALSVLVYNLTRVMNIVGIKPLIAAIAAFIKSNAMRIGLESYRSRWVK
jgi:uncharacterized membrane protein